MIKNILCGKENCSESLDVDVLSVHAVQHKAHDCQLMLKKVWAFERNITRHESYSDKKPILHISKVVRGPKKRSLFTFVQPEAKQPMRCHYCHALS